MQCNQAFCGNPFTNGPFCSPYNTPLQSNQSMYPEIVGEGQVTSITLPDGSMQFFFIPTLKWRSTNATLCNPFATTSNPIFANNNYSISPQSNTNGGSWFIRSIIPFTQSMCVAPNPRNEFPRLGNTDFNHNLNSFDFGYQVKFHSDAWSSTTDLVYFFPSLRQRDFVYMLPCKDKTVQIDTGPAAENTVCHYEVVCSKPCRCTCSVPAPAVPMSLECLVDPKPSPKNNSMSTDDCCCSKQSNKRERDKKKKEEKSKNIMSDSKANIRSVDKSITTYADEGCDCTPADGRETQTRSSDRSVTKPMNKALLKPKWIAKSFSGDSTSDDCSCDNIKKTKKRKRSQDKLREKALLKTRWPSKIFSGDSMSVDCSCDDVSRKRNIRPEDKPMNKSPLKSKRTARSFSGDSMSIECSCDDLSKRPNKDGHETQTLKSHSDHADDKPIHKSLLMPKWTAKGKSGQSTSVACSCDEISKKPNKRSQNNTDAKPKNKSLLMPKKTAKSKSGQSTSVECSCDDISQKLNKSQDNTDAKPMHKSLLMPKWIPKSFSGDSMTDCSWDDASKKTNRRVTDKKYKRSIPKKCDCECDSDNSVANKGGRRTPFTDTCSTCSNDCCTSVLKSKCSTKKAAQKLLRVKSDILWPDCEFEEEEMRKLPTNPSCHKVVQRKSLDLDSLNSSCLDCDTCSYPL